MKWFIIMMAMDPNGHALDRLTDRIQGFEYVSHAACMASARDRAAALASIGVTGSYLCMYHGEPDRELAASTKGEF